MFLAVYTHDYYEIINTVLHYVRVRSRRAEFQTYGRVQGPEKDFITCIIVLSSYRNRPVRNGYVNINAFYAFTDEYCNRNVDVELASKIKNRNYERRGQINFKIYVRHPLRLCRSTDTTNEVHECKTCSARTYSWSSSSSRKLRLPDGKQNITRFVRI